MNTCILVIDDDPSVTSVLRRGLSYEGYQVVTAGSGEQGLDLARTRVPDLAILDVVMPGVDGFEVCRRLRAANAGLPILMLTAKDRTADQVHGLEIGADDYLVKPFVFEVLLARVRALLRRTESARVQELRFADLVLDAGTHTAQRGQREIVLTTTEYELLFQFLRHPRRVLGKDQLVDWVWGYPLDGHENILEVYVGYLRGKLEVGGEPRLIHTIRGAGYLLREPREGENS